MKLTDYIFGSRRGREANRIEREAQVDPFLADAIEGYDSVYGDHSDRLAALEQEVALRAARSRRRRADGAWRRGCGGVRPRWSSRPVRRGISFGRPPRS